MEGIASERDGESGENCGDRIEWVLLREAISFFSPWDFFQTVHILFTPTIRFSLPAA